MRIGFIIYGSLDTLSGGYLYDRKLVEYLRAQGDIVEIISLPWRNYGAHLTDNLSFRLPFSSVNERTALLPTKQSPESGTFDILIQDELNHPSLIAANSGKHPCPVVSLVHHLRCSELRPRWQNYFYRVVEKKYLQNVDGFIFNSKTTEDVVNDLTSHRKPSVVAYPPTDRFGAQVTEAEIIERANIPELRILFLGNVIYRKGLHILIDALARVGKNAMLPCCLDVVGSLASEPKYAQAMQHQASMLSPRSSITFHGALDNNPLKVRLKQAHVLVVPSSYEGFGIVYIEGMGFGLPAIGTTVGAASEVIRDGETGFLIPPEDANMLAERLSALANRRDLLVRLSINALQHYQNQPTWDQTAKAIRKFLLDLTAA